MSGEVALMPTVVVNGVTSLFILQVFLVAVLVAFALKYLPQFMPQVSAARVAIEAEQGVRLALESVITGLKEIPAYQRFTYYENMLLKLVRAAEKLKDGDASGAARSEYVLDGVCALFGADKAAIKADKEKMNVVQKSIDMAVATAGLMGKVEAKQLPFRSGSAVS